MINTWDPIHLIELSSDMLENVLQSAAVANESWSNVPGMKGNFLHPPSLSG